APGYAVEIEIDGGAMIGYCATARSGIEIAPIRQMNSAITQAKTGRSMKKAGMIRYRRADAVSPVSAPVSREASASAHITARTLSPAVNFWKPSTTTRSPALRPWLTIDWPFWTEAVRIGRTITWLSSLTTK